MRKISLLTCAFFCFFVSLRESRAASCSANTSNLLATKNCGFETGSFSSWTVSGNDVPGELGNLYGVEGVDPIDNIGPHSGNSQAYFADLPSNATTISQTIVTITGEFYTISWAMAQDTASTTQYGNAVSAMFGGQTIASLTDVPVEGYTVYTYTGEAFSTSTTLSLTFGNSLGEFLVDDVSVVSQAPEPAAWKMALGGALVAFAAYRFRLTRRNSF